MDEALGTKVWIATLAADELLDTRRYIRLG
jgi:hypothetical protein